MFRHVLAIGAIGGVTIAVLKVVEYRFLVLENSFEIYAAIVAAVFAAVGIWLGLKIALPKHTVEVREVPARRKPFSVNEEARQRLGITPRELELLQSVSGGLSNREIADRLSVSENTVKTHLARVFEKLEVKRRTQAVQIGKELGLIP